MLLCCATLSYCSIQLLPVGQVAKSQSRHESQLSQTPTRQLDAQFHIDIGMAMRLHIAAIACCMHAALARSSQLALCGLDSTGRDGLDTC